MKIKNVAELSQSKLSKSKKDWKEIHSRLDKDEMKQMLWILIKTYWY